MKNEVLTSKLIKASALLADARILLASWRLEETVAENLVRAREQNILGKASRARVEDVLAIFRQRYFSEPEVGKALVTLVQGSAPSGWVDPLLYYYAVQHDATLRALVLEVVHPRKMAGYTDLQVEHFLRAVRDWVAQGRTTAMWGEKTILRVAQHAMAALRDFGILEGAAKKRVATLYLPTEAFAFLALDLMRREGSGEKVLQSEAWKLFFLSTISVERFFLEAHQERLLSYHAAGSVIRIEFPANDLVEYADVLVERARAQA